MQIDERLKIETPEQIALELPIAGIGSRFMAAAIDTVLQLLLVIAAILALSIAPTIAGLRSLPIVAQIGPALSILFAFCVYWGYFACFEIVWSGRTPGKRLAGIRVIKESGRPINFYEAVGRNVMRAVDFLPAFYGVGVVVMVLNRHSRRLGDFVAGTIVVHDKATESRLPAWQRSPQSPASTQPLPQLSDDELVLIEAYLQRRAELDPLVRDQMARQIATRVTAKAGLALPPDRSVDEFLETVACRIRDAARYR